MPVPQTDPDDRVSARKEIFVGNNSGINSISSDRSVSYTHLTLPTILSV